MTRDEHQLTLREWLSAQPFTLAMSSGFFGFFAHTGFLRALEHSGLTPAAMRGSSAGSLIAALWSAGLDTDTIAGELKTLRRSDFWDPFPGPGILRGKKFQQKLADIMPVHDFAGCRVPLHISVFDPLQRRTATLTDGDLISAVRASCAVPVMFHPVWRDRRPYYDGGIRDRPGTCGLAPTERLLYHHLLPWAPWRDKKAPSSRIPARAGMRAVQVAGLPKVSPFRLQRGPRALEQAYDFTMKILDQTPDEVTAGAGIHGGPQV
jgi:NTE family protein